MGEPLALILDVGGLWQFPLSISSELAAGWGNGTHSPKVVLVLPAEPLKDKRLTPTLVRL